MLKTYLFASQVAQPATGGVGNVVDTVSASIATIAVFVAIFTYILTRKIAKQNNALQILRDLENDGDIITERKAFMIILGKYKETIENLEDTSKALKKYAQKNERYKDDSATILSVLNRYEFISVGIRAGAVDEKLVRLWTKTAFITTIARLSLFIKERQDTAHPSAFSELHWLALRWSKGKDQHSQRVRKIIEDNIGHPQLKEDFVSDIIRLFTNNWLIIALFAIQTIVIILLV